jgi:hypothetical protein
MDSNSGVEMMDSRADRRLEAALAERARLTDRYERSIGTELETSAYMRLRAASARLAMQDRMERVAGDDRPRAPFPRP